MLCVNITKRLPEHGSALITDLLQYDGVNMNWEACMSGVSAILTLLAEVPARLAGANDPVHLPATAGVRLDGAGVWEWVPGSDKAIVRGTRGGGKTMQPGHCIARDPNPRRQVLPQPPHTHFLPGAGAAGRHRLAAGELRPGPPPAPH